MPRNQGTSRKGKPKKHERAAGMGRALQKAQQHRHRPKSNGHRQHGQGMELQAGVTSIGIEHATFLEEQKTKSVLELHDLDDFLLQAEMANREFVSEKEGLRVVDEDHAQSYINNAMGKDSFAFQELSVPRRPAWDKHTTPEELHRHEQDAFLEWRRSIAAREEYLVRSRSSSAVTPFEKNLEVWRQLWRVLERSSCLLQLVDARNPLFYLSQDLHNYAADLGKPMMVIVNKSDYLSARQRQWWYDYLTGKGWEVVFFSAHTEQSKLDIRARQERRDEEQRGMAAYDSEDESDVEHEPDEDGAAALNDEPSRTAPTPSTPKDFKPEYQDDRGIDKLLSREELMDYMLAFARRHNCEPDARFENRIQFGMVGFPNVGKSSVINVLVGSSKHTHGVVRVGVASQPGKTKHFQTLLLPDSDEMMLCDCPGLVFPSFVSNTADLIAAGVYPIAQMRDHWPVIKLICQRIPREIINAHYGIKLPVPNEMELREKGLTQLPPPTGDEFLTTLCVARGMLAASSGVPDYTRAARMVIKDYAVGKLLYCHPPPSLSSVTDFQAETIATAVSHAKKLQDKLSKQDQSAPYDQELHEVDAERPLVDNILDEQLLELAGLDSVPAQKNNATAVSKRLKRHGKKGRKGRNKDPYGCHSASEQSTGVVVKAGKHSTVGYTRPTAYGGLGRVGIQ